MNVTNILIVEDELLIAENLAIKLNELNYKVVDIVSSSQAAIAKANTHIPDLILMDIAIKGDTDGIATAAKIRKIHDIPIIFLTAYADEKTLERASQTGCYGYILKPFKDRELHATIKMALSKHQQQSAIEQSLQAKIRQYASSSSPANIDLLTQLPNHLSFQDLFEYILDESENGFNHQPANKDRQLTSESTNQDLLAILYFEIDRFARITDSLSKDSRDLPIMIIAECLKDALKNHENINTTIKLQGSEFVILIAGIQQQAAAKSAAEMILNQFRKPFIIENLEFFLTASIGIAFYPFHETDSNKLLIQAHRAMQYAQKQGGDRCKIYSDSLNLIISKAKNRILIETELHYALKRQELELYYQPKIDLRTGKIVGAEALARWHHPQIGLVMPNQFITIAEQSSLIESIGEWALITACTQTQSWHQAGFNDLSIAVNLSGRQFKQLDLFHKLTQIMFDSGLKPECLELELTEKILVENEKLNIQRLNLIKKLNVQISLDDFGTGYSSLGYLQQFPFNVLKIDRCFIKDIDRNTKNAVITKSVIVMAHQLGLKVVAEGVETQAELAFLVDCQCDLVQGFLLSGPLPAKDFEQLLVNNKVFEVSNVASTADV